MTDTKFTPGPWKTAATNIYAPGEDGANIASVSEPRTTMEVKHTPVEIDSEDIEEAFANATLIAAAPDMYEALAELVETYSWEESLSAPGGVVSNARAALRKARGEDRE